MFSTGVYALTPPDNRAGGLNAPVTAVCFSPDMQSFAAGTSEGDLQIWSLKTGTLTYVKQHATTRTEVQKLAFSDSGKWLWWLHDGHLYRCAVPELKPEMIEANVGTFVFSASGNYLAIGKQDGKIIVLSPNQPEYKKELNPEKPGAVTSLAFSRSEKRLASSNSKGVILVQDINTAFVYKRLEESSKSKTATNVLLFNVNDKYLLTGSADKLQLWDVFEGKVKKTSTRVRNIHTLEMGENGRCVFAGGIAGAFYLDVESLEPIKTFSPPRNSQFGTDEAMSMDISPDGHFLLQGCADNSARLWHVHYDGALLTFAVDPYEKTKYAVFAAGGDFFAQPATNIPDFRGYVPKLGNHNPELIARVLQQIEPEAKAEAKAEIVQRAGKDYALFFAIGDYQEWNKLKNPVPDAEAIATRLKENYGFQTDMLVNPTRDQIYAQLEKYRSITFPDDGQLFVFFSGHGEFVDATGEGFIIPKEGLNSEKDRFQNTYIPHARLEKMLDAIPCRHILVALDACYSGTFDQEIAELKGETNFKRPGEGSKSTMVQRELEAQSRIYLTSGGKERTPDGVVHSPFAEKMLDALDSEGGDDSILTINELFSYLEKAAPKPRKGRFGKHDPNGTFLFVKHSKE